MDLRLSGKTAVIAGASRGIGRATALALAAEGAHLVLAARGEEALRKVATEAEAAGAEVLALPCDLTSAGDAERLVEATADRFRRIDILVNSIHFSASGDDDERRR
jgi:3-oxoacyl-[acyl-carrier protein] reductase